MVWIVSTAKLSLALLSTGLITLGMIFYWGYATPPQEVLCDDGVNLCTVRHFAWVEGLAVIIGYVLSVATSLFDLWQTDRMLDNVDRWRRSSSLTVIRDGQRQIVDTKEILVGDIAQLELGDIIPCHGILLSGRNVNCVDDDDGSISRKYPYKDCVSMLQDPAKNRQNLNSCFVLSGSRIVEGAGLYLIVNVDPISLGLSTASTVPDGDEASGPLRTGIELLANKLTNYGLACGVVVFVFLATQFLVRITTEPDTPVLDRVFEGIQIITLSITSIVAVTPDGLLAAVTLSKTLALRQMTRAGIFVRTCDSSETVANMSVICVNKTGTLTQNNMSVVAGSIGTTLQFHRYASRDRVGQDVDLKEFHPEVNSRPCTTGDSSVDVIKMSNLSMTIQAPLRELIGECLAINSTAYEGIFTENGTVGFTGSSTEVALLCFARDLKLPPYQQTRSNADIVQVFPFSSKRKTIGTVIRTVHGKYRLYISGAAEIMAGMYSYRVVNQRPATSEGSKETHHVRTVAVSELDKETILSTTESYSKQILRPLAIAYRDFEFWPPPGHLESADGVPYETIANNLTLVSILGIQDPPCPDIQDFVAKFREAGVDIKICTGESIHTMTSLVSHCSLMKDGDCIMDGASFSGLPPEQQLEIAPSVRVLARCSPEDKVALLSVLKRLGETVGMIGCSARDGTRLETADIRFALGGRSTEITKATSDIVLSGNTLDSILSSIMCGRSIYDSARRLLQFYMSIMISLISINILGSLPSVNEESALSTMQLIWINLISDTLVFLALVFTPITPKLLKRSPDPDQSLFTKGMRTMIVGESVYQVSVVVVFYFAGPIFREYESKSDYLQLSGVVFGLFVFCQIFNSVNCRILGPKTNIFSGLFKEWAFLGITVTEVIIQIIVMTFGGNAFLIVPINLRDWGMVIALGFVPVPLGYLLRYVSAHWERCIAAHLHTIWAAFQKIKENLKVGEPADEKARKGGPEVVHTSNKDLSAPSRSNGFVSGATSVRKRSTR